MENPHTRGYTDWQAQPMNKKPKKGKTDDIPSPRAQLIEELRQARSPDASGLTADPIRGNSDVLIAQWRQQYSDESSRALMLGLRLRRLGMLLDEITMRQCEIAGLKLNEMLLLMALRRVGEPFCLRPTDILKMHSVTSGTVTYRIDQLTKQGLAERIPDPNDRRGYLIRLTQEGLAVVSEMMESLFVAFDQHLAPMKNVSGALAIFEESLRLFEQCVEPLARDNNPG